MASIVRDSNSRKRLQVVLDGRKVPIRLGAMSMRQAEAIKVRVEQLVTAKTTGILDPEASAWVAKLEEPLYGRLVAAGLLSPSDRAKATVGELLAAFFDTLAVKDGTATTYKQTRRSLEDHFGAATPLSAIGPLEADRWRQSMRDEGLAVATISKRVKTARQIFKQGIKWKMLTENPLVDVKAGPQTNAERMYFISAEDAARVLDACPNPEWRAIFALSRYGGLRCPSEHMALRWEHIDWATGKMMVRSTKTEAQGKAVRFVPLFPELRAVLLAAFEAAEPGAEWVVSRYRDPSCNLRTQFTRIIERAGLAPWPRLFHNLRSSRQTELAARFPIHVVCSWLGNSAAVAQAHYLQVRSADFEAAVRGDTATQNATQHAAAPGRSQRPPTIREVANPADLREVAALCHAIQEGKVTPAA